MSREGLHISPPFWRFLPTSQELSILTDRLQKVNESLVRKTQVPLLPEILVGYMQMSTPWKINMEHNHRGWEDHFPF